MMRTTNSNNQKALGRSQESQLEWMMNVAVVAEHCYSEDLGALFSTQLGTNCGVPTAPLTLGC